jgi:hypothetical protein
MVDLRGRSDSWTPEGIEDRVILLDEGKGIAPEGEDPVEPAGSGTLDPAGWPRGGPVSCEAAWCCTPATAWQYNTGLTLLIKEILKEATGMSAKSFTNNHFLSRIECQPYWGFLSRTGCFPETWRN